MRYVRDCELAAIEIEEAAQVGPPVKDEVKVDEVPSGSALADRRELHAREIVQGRHGASHRGPGFGRMKEGVGVRKEARLDTVDNCMEGRLTRLDEFQRAALGSQPGSECQRVPDLLGPEPIEIDRPAVPESKSHRRTSRQVEAFFSRCLRET